MNLDDTIRQSKEIFEKAVADFQPSAIVVMLSGGDDSLTVLALCEILKIKYDRIIHAITGTGLPEAQMFIEEIGKGKPLVFADSGTAYQDYVLRKGFFGVGNDAHSKAYHVLKATGFRKEISKIRQRRQNFKVLCLNGVRIEESDNRANNYAEQVWRSDPGAKSNIWLNLIHYWTKQECLELLEIVGMKRSPVSVAIGSSGECNCGTMHNLLRFQKCAEFSPDWGKQMMKLRKEVIKKFGWDWGQSMPKGIHLEKKGQGNLFRGFYPDFQPACFGCKRNFVRDFIDV